jgi:hypothetical protein
MDLAGAPELASPVAKMSRRRISLIYWRWRRDHLVVGSYSLGALGRVTIKRALRTLPSRQCSVNNIKGTGESHATDTHRAVLEVPLLLSINSYS